MPTIDIRIKDKIAMQTGGEAFIVRDNSDYVINFTFDVEWAEETAKTARFALQRGGYMDVPFTGSSVAVPVISTGRRVDVGVFAGNLRTTTSATLPLVPSIRSKGGAPVPPEDAVYDKLIALINSMGEISDDDIKQAVEDYLSANPIAAASMRVDSGYIQYSTDNGKTWVNLIAEADLKGDKGDTGAQGPQGDTGPKGETGPQGPQGETGPQGPAGADGADGITPTIGENGNWYIGSTDTGNPSRGATGPQGPAGAPGKDGAGMDITGATVGQIAKITAVDASGVPTAWAPVDMPSGGGGSAETFELIKYIKTTEAVSEIRINADDIGEPFELKELQIYTQLYLKDDASAPIGIRLHSSINGSTTNYDWPFIANSPSIKSDTTLKYPAAYAGHFKPKDYTIDNKKYWVADTWSTSIIGLPQAAGAVNRIDFLIPGAYETHLMDAVRCVMINAKNGAVQIGANSKIWIFGKRGKVT